MATGRRVKRYRAGPAQGVHSNIFRHGNRNAASHFALRHLWASFLLDRASSMSTARFKLMFSGFCAVSRSPVQPGDYTRYRLTLPLVAGGHTFRI